ncbi:MAG: hypothetical protein R3E12_08745 [Candidatus Eisenbacteria bacterium]
MTVNDTSLAPPDVATLLIDRFRRTAPFRRLDSASKGGKQREADWLRGSVGIVPRAAPVASPGNLTARLFVVVPDLATAEDLRKISSSCSGGERGDPESGLDPYHARHPRLSTRAARIRLASLADPLWRRSAGVCAARVILVTSVSLLTRFHSVTQALGKNIHRVKVGEAIDPDMLMDLLIAGGYEPAHMVSEYGEVSRRGGILDVFSFGRANPVRIEFDDDEVASLREFDPYAQRSIGEIEEAVLLPTWEWIVGLSQAEALRGSRPAEVPEDRWDQLIESLETDNTLEGIE